jgi:hypothetical protein
LHEQIGTSVRMLNFFLSSKSDPLDIGQLIRGRGISQVTFAESSVKSEISTPASRRVGTGEGNCELLKAGV